MSDRLEWFTLASSLPTLDIIDTGNEASKRDLKATHDALTASLVTGQSDIIHSVVFEFEKPLPFMFAGAWSPFTDLYGAKLQNGLTHELLEQIFVSSFAGDTTAMVCISWRNIDGAIDGMDVLGSIPSVPIRLDIDFQLPKTLRVSNVL